MAAAIKDYDSASLLEGVFLVLAEAGWAAGYVEAPFVEVHYHRRYGLALHVRGDRRVGVCADAVRFTEVVPEHLLDPVDAYSAVPSLQRGVRPA